MHDRDGDRRKPYARPRSAVHERVAARRSALAATWLPVLSYGEARALMRMLDRCKVRFAAAGERRAAAEMQGLRTDVAAGGRKPRTQLELAGWQGDEPSWGISQCY